MDELGTDVQILYPTIFINPVTSDPAAERALCKSYNRCLADVWSQSNNRLRWAAVLPLMSMDAAIEELHKARDNGACSVVMRGVETDNRLLIDPYFHRLYQEVSDLDMSICIHTGNGSTDIMSIFPNNYGFPRFKLIGVGAFQVLCESRLPDRFPNLRWGFIELSAQWIPYVIKDLLRRFERRDIAMKDNVLRDNRIWVTCQTNDDLEYIMSYVGDDNLVIGTDYGHADTSTEVYAMRNLAELAGVSQESARKILDDNARALYGL
jgi:predicted TIM-barrel fold metal-dependent hydrolase